MKFKVHPLMTKNPNFELIGDEDRRSHDDRTCSTSITDDRRQGTPRFLEGHFEIILEILTFSVENESLT